MNILTQGERRFRLVEVIQWVPHLVGLVQYLDDEPGEISASLVEEVNREYATFLRHMSSLAGGWNSRVEVTDDPQRLASEAQVSLASSIEWPTDIRQQLLESTTVQQRLERVLPLLQRGNRVLQERVDENNPLPRVPPELAGPWRPPTVFHSNPLLPPGHSGGGRNPNLANGPNS